MASNALNKVASAMQKRAGAWEDFKAGAYSTLNNPDTWRLAATYGAPIVGGGVLGALLNRKNRLLGAALGMGGGAAVGGGLHALQAYNVGGLGDAAQKLFDKNYELLSKQYGGSDKYLKARKKNLDYAGMLYGLGEKDKAKAYATKGPAFQQYSLAQDISNPKVRAAVDKFNALSADEKNNLLMGADITAGGKGHESAINTNVLKALGMEEADAKQYGGLVPYLQGID